MKVILKHPGEHPDYHVYEILNIFSRCDIKYEPFSDALSVVCEDGAGNELSRETIDMTDRKVMKRSLYEILSRLTGYESPWGAITGVRPCKTVNDIAAKNAKNGEPDFEEADRELKDFYLVSGQKRALAISTAKNQRKFLEDQRNNPQKIDLYVAIPFCPSRCLYCSFTSNSIIKYRKYVDSYLDHLEEELKCCARIAKENGFVFDSIYLGGGTPTSFDDERFERYMSMILNTIDMSTVGEFALEAGRPDSITEGKLRTAKTAGVNRLSINPQTMNEKTLRRIGRAHNTLQVYEAFELARKEGFYNINTDIIAGLPGESIDDFATTLEKIGGLSPEGLTVHTLSVKRAADLKLDLETQSELRPDDLAVMTTMGYDFAISRGMLPFYLYRQKNMLGNHENVGYCLPGHESPYNIHIMEEDKTILAAGAGSVTKYVTGGDIFRIYDVKSIEEYDSRWQEMIDRKNELFGVARAK